MGVKSKETIFLRDLIEAKLAMLLIIMILAYGLTI